MTYKSDEETVQKENLGFLYMFNSMMQDGFLGGVQWGIAVSFYTILARIVSSMLSSVPYIVARITYTYDKWYDRQLGIPPRLNVHELQVLVTLLHEVLEEYENISVDSVRGNACAALSTTTLTSLMRHIHAYVTVRAVRYTKMEDQEILFFLQLAADTLEHILPCIECIAYRQEVIASTKTVLIILTKLVILLQGPLYESEPLEPALTLFSRKDDTHAPHD